MLYISFPEVSDKSKPLVSKPSWHTLWIALLRIGLLLRVSLRRISGVNGVLVDNRLHLVLFHDWSTVSRSGSGTAHARLGLSSALTVKVDAEGDQRGDEEHPLERTERGCGLGRTRVAGVGASLKGSLGLVAVAAVAVRGTVDIRVGRNHSQRGEGREPEDDAQALEDEVRILIVGGGEVEDGQFDLWVLLVFCLFSQGMGR
jgi:hypothetical protein